MPTSYPTGMNIERDMEIGAARAALTGAVLAAVAKRFGAEYVPGTLVSSADIDRAAAVLVDALRHPETCFSCGQEVKSND